MGRTTARRRPIAAFDLDGSLVREQLLVLLTKECFDLQIFRKVTEVVFKDIRLQHRDRKISFEVCDRKIIDLFTERIRGKLVSDLEIAAEQVFRKHKDWLYVFSRALLAALRPTHECITITGAAIELVRKLGPYWGFEHFYATELEIEAGRYTGRNKYLPVTDKKAALLAHVAKTRATLKGSIALGDSASDIPLLAAVDIPIAFNPNDNLSAEAEKCGWPVVLERKDCIYVLVGGTSRRFPSARAEEAVSFVLSKGTAKR